LRQRFFGTTDDIELTDVLWDKMCSLLAIDGANPQAGLTKEMLRSTYEL